MDHNRFFLATSMLCEWGAKSCMAWHCWPGFDWNCWSLEAKGDLEPRQQNRFHDSHPTTTNNCLDFAKTCFSKDSRDDWNLPVDDQIGEPKWIKRAPVWLRASTLFSKWRCPGHRYYGMAWVFEKRGAKRRFKWKRIGMQCKYYHLDFQYCF